MAHGVLNGGLDAADERAISALLVRYATAIDIRDWALFRFCFAEDVEADYGSFGKWHGPREITDFMRDVHAARGATLHRVSNITIQREGGQVCARSYIDAILMPGQASGIVHRAVGLFDDRLVRTSEGWKISRRSFRAVLLE